MCNSEGGGINFLKASEVYKGVLFVFQHFWKDSLKNDSRQCLMQCSTACMHACEGHNVLANKSKGLSRQGAGQEAMQAEQSGTICCARSPLN